MLRGARIVRRFPSSSATNSITVTDPPGSLPPSPRNAALFEAAADMIIRGDVTGLAKVLNTHPGLVGFRSRRPHGATLLHYSAANGVEDERQIVPPNAVEVANLLIDRGADINAVANAYGGGPGSTPLVALVTGGHPNEAGLMAPLVHAYARSGQNLNGVDDDGLPLAYAFLFRNVEAAAALALAGARVDNAATAAGMGALDVVKTLVEAGDPPTADPAGTAAIRWTDSDSAAVPVLALYFACIAGQREVAVWLVEAGVDVNRKVHHGMTALHEACWGGHLDVVKVLVEAGADLYAIEDQHASTPADWAAHAGHGAVAEYLRQAPGCR